MARESERKYKSKKSQKKYYLKDYRNKSMAIKQSREKGTETGREESRLEGD